MISLRNIEISPKIIWTAVVVGIIALLVGGFMSVWNDVATYSVYYDKYYKIQMKYPTKWQKMEDIKGSIVAFVAPKEEALETMPPNCNVTVSDNLGEEMTLEDFAKHATMQTETIFGTSIEVLESKQTTISEGYPAHVYVIKSKIPPIIQLKFVLYLKDNKGFMITCMADELNFTKSKGTFKDMIDSYRIDVKK